MENVAVKEIGLECLYSQFLHEAYSVEDFLGKISSGLRFNPTLLHIYPAAQNLRMMRDFQKGMLTQNSEACAWLLAFGTNEREI